MTEISRRQFAVYLVAVVLVVLLGGRALRADAGPAERPDAASFTAQGEAGTGRGASGPSGATTAGGLEVTTTPERVLVHVAGAVRRPGVYELGADARIRDALAEAGGARAGADLDVVNLAAKVTDGQQVLVARRSRAGRSATPGAVAPGAASGVGAAAGGTGATAAPGGMASINVNQADVTQLEVLNGVGPAIAAKIVDWRTQNGPFRAVDDLAQVPGIGPKKLEAMRSQVVV